MNRHHPLRLALCLAVAAVPCLAAQDPIPSSLTPKVIVSTTAEPIAPGPFEPTWQSLSKYKVPDWFRDAKFGIWAHWGPQCEPEDGDWYARNLYEEGSKQYKDHLARYGPPSQFGFKDVIHQWKAQNWDPDKLVALYKRVGAQYFFAMANHHDNFDLWDSKYQPWNSVNMGPKKDLIAGWAAAAKRSGLPFGVSVHAAHAWTWYEAAQGADKEGPLAGVPYDGKLTRADGKGKWWDGFDPQDLYEQSHVPSLGFEDAKTISSQWGWGNGASQPNAAYCEKFYNRTVDLINRYHPDLIYFDDTALPLWPVSDAGLKITAHFYNQNIKENHGQLKAVVFGKVLTDDEKKALVWDYERGIPREIKVPAWQTDTCIGGWHYDRSLYEKGGYKSAVTVIHMLADIVSKNGNLLLNIPVRGDGSVDDKEEAVLQGIAAWMDVNKESIFGTRPWKVFGEGPVSAGATGSARGVGEGKGKPLTAEDVRFTTRNGAVYAILMGMPTKPVAIRSLGAKAGLTESKIASVEQLGTAEKLTWHQDDAALTIQPASVKPASDAGVVYKITFQH